jgi:DNA-binding protein HU-beta
LRGISTKNRWKSNGNSWVLLVRGASNGLLLFGLTTALLFAMAQICEVGWWFILRFKRTWVTRITGFWHNPGLPMTKTELQSALAEATQTDKRTAGVFLDTLSDIAYKEIKKNGEFVLPGFGKLVKQKRKARTGFNPKTQQKIKIPAKTVVKFRVAKAAKDGVLGVKK